ncbi:glycosyltransferase family 2 protein [Aetokthonos hydrillicola Thurmond2011]|jgi:glycosyltransferase involved in cell wall biosynthesis|uniref:Glycosyltransferase family 2 protein n=1 Tax=Aetokthonos hydrillicola Thurmond2011 TaxID=2712845 RepID=A0AAP5I4G5_9CYAN|nr:glycosyltransferase family A protein [Aetokthonos hydrillicola]MBO3460917.1 glycosyltransferase family 2 protein [Aetokthonos hydrillicola CCALA 1050]MBW4586466.1 glycosyltransferase family 2 protein [Aetokthonos hydrillicola CCALA 1050]MDR9893589.1 glycosyltransferase family 2 protein [Aetokthonos hydrillicola Thurmond2011]
MPKVSVIIPAYNAMNYLPETLESVLQQSFSDFEVLIIDDGSSDNIQEWVSLITDPRVKLLTQKNQGLSGARNTGIHNSHSEYIAFLDADDLWEPTKLEKQVRCLEENPEVGLVYTWTALIDHKGISTGRVFVNYAEGYVWKSLIEHNIVECGSVPMVRRCCFETEGVFDRNLRSYVEDWDMWLRIAARYPLKLIKEPLVKYRQHSASASRNWEAMEQSFRIVIEKAFNAAPNELQYLKSRSYGCANLCLAWKPLQSQQKDLQKSIYYRRQALIHYPQLRFSKEYLRLSLAIAILEFLGIDGYSKLLNLFYTWRRNILNFFSSKIMTKSS